jgi:hypothetical protein
MTKTTPKGPTPSLIGGSNGRPKRVEVKKLSNCYRCNESLTKGTMCIEVPKLGGAYSSARRMCDDCFKLMLSKTASDLAEINAL